MSQPEIQIKRVHEKMQAMLRQFQALQKENERLKEDIKKMQVLGETLSRDAEKIRHQADVQKLSGRGLDETEKRILEKRLNQYVREIDKCIALLQE